MGLFSKKKIEEKQELPPLKFPEFSKEDLPSYETAIRPPDQDMIKKVITQQSISIPLRKQLPPKTEGNIPIEEYRPRGEERQRPRIEERMEYRPQREKTLFIKVDKYKDIMAKMNEIKTKVAEAEKIMQKLNEIKTQEEAELKTWQEDINRIKDSLINIDRTLFE